MLKPFLAAVAFATLAPSAPAAAAEVPYVKLAQALGTPELANSSGPKDRSQLLLHFVRGGETYARWTKMTTVSIVRVPPADTDGATRGIIDRLRTRLSAAHATIDSFDQSPVPPVSGYFSFRGKGESDAGIVYSPSPGYVTVAQLGVRGTGHISKADIARLRSVIGK
ncbi:MAG: hypothetical protein NVSMB19_13020 [Vulcanimicrobiaceae bacterium]